MLSDSIPCIIGSFFWHSDGWTFTFNSFLFSDSSKKSQKKVCFYDDDLLRRKLDLIAE